MHIEVGPYRFSAMDARRTLVHADDLLDGFAESVHAHQTERRARIAAAVDGLDQMHADVDDLRSPIDTVWRELLAAREDALAAGALPATATGQVVHLAVSDGGVPKRAVDRIEVDFGGVVGDRQATRRHHGSPFQALCIWNEETIAGLVADEHPIAAGAAGENVTVAGIDWPSLCPGVRLRIGTVLCEISSYAVPCKQNARWFSDGVFDRIHHRHGPISRLYATVIEPGTVKVDDLVIVEPET
ncbi:MAG: MOSC domain-containing protein [Ilumatobacteraceae bacterium]